MSCLFERLYRCVEPAPPTIVGTLPVSAMQSLLVAGLTASQGIWHFTSRLHMFSTSHNFFLSLLLAACVHSPATYFPYDLYQSTLNISRTTSFFCTWMCSACVASTGHLALVASLYCIG